MDNIDEQLRPAPLEVGEEVAQLLMEKLDTENITKLRDQTVSAEAWAGRIAFQHRSAQHFLSALKRQYLPGKVDRNVTELDRAVTMEARVSQQQAVVDILGDYFRLLGTRVSLGQSLLASLKQEMKSNIN